jgi:hypothetical protein
MFGPTVFGNVLLGIGVLPRPTANRPWSLQEHPGWLSGRDTARKEFGLTQDEIVQAVGARKLQFRHAAMHGNPFLRLLRREVEALVKKKHGDDYLRVRQAKTQLARIDRELKRLKIQVADLEERRACLLKEISRRAGAGS